MTPVLLCSFFFNDTATNEIYTLSLHDALPTHPFRINYRFNFLGEVPVESSGPISGCFLPEEGQNRPINRKSTRLNSSHTVITNAGFSFKKKKIMGGMVRNVVFPSCVGI